jgi:crossover junction endodeoxyribonuclease RuvC
MKTLISIDPGITGALCIWEPGKTPWLEDIPVMKRGKANVINAAELARIIGGLEGPVDVWLEDVHAMPKNGCLASFSLGRSVGAIYGVCAALGYAVSYVAPQTWKKGLGIPAKADKDASRSIAIERVPGLAGDLARKMDHGRGDAVCIGLWARGEKLVLNNR